MSATTNEGDQMPRSHQLAAASTDCTIAGSAFFAVAAFVIGIPSRDAALISWFAAALGFLTLVVVILRGTFNPVMGSLLRASVASVGVVAVAAGTFAVCLLARGEILPASLPMVATVASGLLCLSAARIRATEHR